MALLDFDSIKSIDDQDGVWGADELSLTVDGEEVWQSVGVNSGEKFNLEALDPIPISASSEVKLLEDDPIGNDTIGSFNPIFTKSPVELNEADGIYDVAFTVI
ncbi:MAG: hypothetical protein BRC35_14545 [Cyanobacteria bacterium QH_10_48_56]|nr:MAG: hypothetical protein BRC35_14545 [Cyanobacteria bacterium QH_10_48_56]